MKKPKIFKNQLIPAKFPLTFAQLTGNASEACSQDFGVVRCKAIYPLMEYINGKMTSVQIGWTYQCIIPAQGGASVLVKVNELSSPVTPDMLALGPVPMRFSGFRGIWWVKNGNIELSCRADFALKA